MIPVSLESSSVTNGKLVNELLRCLTDPSVFKSNNMLYPKEDKEHRRLLYVVS